MRGCYGDHFAEKLGNNREQLGLAGISCVDTTYIGRGCGRFPLPKTAAGIKAMPFCGGEDRKEAAAAAEEKALEEDLEKALSKRESGGLRIPY